MLDGWIDQNDKMIDRLFVIESISSSWGCALFLL